MNRSIGVSPTMRTSILCLLICSFVGSLAVFTNQPRLQTVDGHLYIYGGTDKNVTFMTTSKGFINVNGENLYGVVQDAKLASQLIKGLKYKSVTKMEEGMMAVMTTLDQFSQRLNVCETFLTSKSKDKSLIPTLTTLNWRVRKLEKRVRRISGNLMRNECRRDPCLNGGTCLDRYLGYECRCPEGWEGKKCEKDVNECAIFAGTDLGCQNGATCYNTRGSYKCECALGWHGLHCVRRTADCSSGSVAELCGHGICVSQLDPMGYTCICNQGWKNDGVSRACIVDVDECATSPCSRNPPVLCHNAPGSFFCGPCPSGYTGNGFQCADVDECLVENGGCSVQPMVTCINTFGSSTCGPCPPGYSGDGRTCVFVGKCQVNNGGCHPNARCTEIGSNVQCQCLPGYTGYGIGPYGCEALSGPVTTNPCLPNPCQFGGRCYATGENTFTCSCMPGFSGPTCNVVNSCDSNPCQNGGTCEAKGNDFRCKCLSSYKGVFCEERKEECGEYLKGDAGVLKFPAANSSSTGAFNCAWVIRVNTSHVINVTFDQFELRSSFECQLEWLEIHDGRSTSDVTVGRYCGGNPPRNTSIVSTQNYVYIWFGSIAMQRKSHFQLSWSAVDPVCGGAINASVHGVITSPGYPGKYPHNRDCYWEVSAPIGKRIMFTIFELQLNSGPSCTADYIQIHEGMSLDSPLLAKFCNSSSPEIIETPGNTAFVYFHTDSKGNDRGFQIAYHPRPGHPGCGGIFTSLRGEIVPPTRNGMYLPNMDCAWIIRLPEERRIRIEFAVFNLQFSRTCRDDFLEVRDGGDITSPLLGKYCGSTLPPPISSNTRTMYIRFYSDEFVERNGFRIWYKSLCDETFTSPSGVVKSPGYPSTYKNEEECVLIIEQPIGKIINLEFQEFEIESTYRCIFDYVEIRDGHDESSPLIGRYCGSNRPGRIVSSNNYLYIKMVTDNNVELAGFYGNYSTVDVSCGGIHTAPSGVIVSPSEGNRYPSNSYCKWVIALKPGQLIQLTFDKFKIEGFKNCLFDYVEVYDNSTAIKGNNLIGRYCNYDTPPLLTSSSNVITIIFKSDSSFTDEGFTATYTAVNGSSICGGKFFTEWGVIKSPNYPDLYPNGLSCSWVIRVKNGHKIHLNITDFLLERPFIFGNKNCKFDYLEIRDGGYVSSPLIGRYCGTQIPKQIMSQSNNLYLEFSSDNLDAARGFQIIWDGSIKGCGGTLTSPSGSIISPNYPERYGSVVNCVYRVSVSFGSKIQLNFVDLDLEASKDCTKEYIEIFDGSDLQSNSLGKFCTLFNLPPNVISSGNHLVINFKSGLKSSGKGFYLKYFTVCHTNVTGYRGAIESPNFPNDYPASLDCLWSIKAPVGNKIRVAFTDLNLRGSCNNAYIEVSEGNPQFSVRDRLRKLCKNNKTMSLESSEEWLHIHLVTSDRSIGGNFRLEWAVKGCGGYLTKPSGTFTSPNYPNVYPTNIHCEWWITVDPLKSITLVLSDMNFEKTEECTFDGIEVYGGPDKSSPLLTRICSTRKDSVILTSSGNNMHVYFHSDVSNTGRGFKATYYTAPSSCGGLFTSHFGSIHSRNYPKNYQLDDCEWHIYMDVNHRVNLTFVSFDINDQGNCSKASVEVFDGPSIRYPSLWRHCGNALPENSTIISTSDALTVRMKVSNSTNTAKGFMATYKMICGGTVNADIPGFVEGGSNSQLDLSISECTWLLTTYKPDGHIILTFSHMALSYLDETDSSCLSEHILVYDGPNENATLIGTYCSFSSPLPIVSQGNELFVKYIAGWTFNTYFKLTYTSASSACGGDLSSERGLFASPNYPNSYPPKSECIWTIKSAPGNRVQLAFRVFDIGVAENCNDEYVEIRLGDAKGKLMGTYCGSDIPTNLTAHNSIWVKFKSNTGGAGTMRFLADYSLVYGNEINGVSGQIASPNYPKMFGSNTPVTWRVTVALKKRVLIQIKDLFIDSTGLEDCLSSLTIYDGFDQTAPVLLKKCDGDIPSSPLTSSSNVIYIILNSESFNMGSKFFLDWSETKSKTDVPIVPTSSPVPGCGGEYFLSSQDNSSLVVTAPANDDPKRTFIKCVWKISCQEEEHLSVTVKSLDMTTFINCEYSHITISTNFGGKWKELVKLCENKGMNTTVHGHSVLLITYYHNDAPATSPASFFVRRECGGSIRKTNGIINFDWRNYSSINTAVLGNNRLRKYSCQWDITVTPGRTIRTTLIQFNGLNTDDGICQDNFFYLRNGGSEDSPYLGAGVYCSVTGIVPRTISNKLFIKVFASYHFHGFTLMFEEVPHNCGGKITLDDAMNSTVISSPNYPNIPPIKVECVWKFVTVGVRRLQIDFIDRFDLAHSQGCKTEYVSVRDGGTELSSEIGRFCSEKPSTVKTTGNMMYVKYFTNTTDPQNGFKARVSLDRCGGIITSSSGVIVSPGYPNSYPYHTECRWEIETNSMSTLKISFEDVDLPHNFSWLTINDDLLMYTLGSARSRLLIGRNCSSSARITITEPGIPVTDKFPRRRIPGMWQRPLEQNNMADNLLGVICSNGKNESIRTSKNKAVITFDSGVWDMGHYFATPRGFKLNFTSDTGGCLHKLYAESGVIESPKNPVGQLGYYNCEWRITVPRGRRVSVTVIEPSIPFASTDALLIAYNDFEHRSQIGSLLPKTGSTYPVIQSTFNVMAIIFVSPYSARYNAFKLSYNSDEVAVCGGNVSESSGLIESPKNLTSFYCPWYFTQRPRENQTLSVTVYDSVIGNRTGTWNWTFGSYLSFRSEGGLVDINVVMSGNVSFRIIRTPFSTATLKGLKSNIFFGDVNFKAKYKTSPCGGVITSSESVITSPNYPDNYPNDVECAWLVSVPFDSSVKVTFEDVQFDTKTPCNDYLTIRNGPGPNSPMIEELCGMLVENKPIISETSYVFIEFHSNEKDTGRGFKIRTETITAACGGIVHSQNTVITSPHFPKPYANNEECEWEIRSKVGTHIGLVFQDRFHIEDSADCQKDYLKVFDYVEEDWKLIKKICGREFPAPINSTTNRMKIIFHSDVNVTSDGFKAKWYTNCGATFSNVKSGRIVSPGYPEKYPSDIRCEYIIKYPIMEIDFNFTAFHLEKDSQGSCVYDSVEFFQAHWSEGYQSEGKFCGSTLPAPKSLYQDVKIVFTTDTYASFSGFDLNFRVQFCGGLVTEPTEITMTFSGMNYLMQNVCRWTIIAPDNKIVVLRFTKLNLMVSQNYQTSALKVTETDSKGSQRVLGLLSGYVYQNLPTIRSHSSNVTLETDHLYYDPDSSFSVVVSFSYGKEQGCGGIVSLDSNPETIQSPDINRDGKYEELLDCNWLILAKPFHYITANFLRIDVDNCNSTESSANGNCSCDVVELRNGMEPTAEVIQSACGKSPPPAVVSSGNVLSLRFFTDGFINRKGFSVQFSSALSECGYGLLNVTGNVKTLTSPHYPDKYPLGCRCKWVLSDSSVKEFYKRSIVHVHVLEWDLEEGDSLTFRMTTGVMERNMDGTLNLNASFNIVGKDAYSDYSNAFLMNDRTITGKGKSLDYYAKGQEVTIDFVSKGVSAKKGFKLEYSIAGCTRNYSSDHGQIIVSYHKILSCDIVIEAPTKNHTIALYFNSIHMLQSQGDCSLNYIEVRDGRSTNSPLIRKFCGFSRPKPLFSSGQYLRMKISLQTVGVFSSQSLVDLTYTTTDQGKGCGGRVSAMRGVIYSPEYPLNVRKNSKCRWDITVPQGLEVILQLKNFDIGAANICDTDFLQIVDVNSDGSETTRATFCGDSNPGDLRSLTGVAVVYQRSVHNGGTGWEIEYKLVVPGSDIK